jgi:hypothetical protein
VDVAAQEASLMVEKAKNHYYYTVAEICALAGV